VSGEKLGEFDVAIYAASVDDVETNTSFAKELGLDYPILSDPTKATARAYGVLAPGKEYASRWTFIIGKDGMILDVLRNVNPSTHGADLAARLAELGVPKKGAPASPNGSAAPSASAAPTASSPPAVSAKPGGR
jgi:peroxiredoxin Q/BCP